MTRARDLSNLIGSGNYTSTTFTATAGQTAFTIAHTQGFIQVFMNGLLLDETTDYTSNGTAVTLTEAATAGDELEVVKYNTFSVGDAITQTDADTRYVNASGDTMTSDLILQHTNGNGIELKLNESDNFAIQRFVTDGTDDNRYIIAYGPDHPAEAGNFAVKNIKAGGEIFLEAAGGAQGLRVTSTGQVTLPEQPRAWMSKTSANSQNLTGGNGTHKITFGSYTAVNGITFSNSNNRLTIPSTGGGDYVIQAFAAGSVVTANAGDGMYLNVYKNGSAIWGSYAKPLFGAGTNVNEEWTVFDGFTVPLSGSDYIELYITGVSTSTSNFSCTRARLSLYAVG